MFIVALVIILALVCYVFLYRHQPVKGRLPPGPKPAPLVGNALQLPAQYQERTYLEWGRQFGMLDELILLRCRLLTMSYLHFVGDIVYAKVFHTHIVVVNSLKIAQDLMDGRSAIYSDRPPCTLLGEV